MKFKNLPFKMAKIISKSCEDGKLFNPESGRCIKDTPANRRKLGMKVPKEVSKKTPGRPPKDSAKKTPGRPPKSSAKKTPGRPPKSSAKKTPGRPPKSSAKKTPGRPPKSSPKKTPGRPPKSSPKKTPGRPPKDSAKKTPKKVVNKNTKESCEKDGKLYNPESGRCVKDTRANRRKLGMKVEPSENAVRKPAERSSKGSPKKNTKESCEKDGKLFNPESGRCIKNTKANRKKLGIKEASAEKQTKGKFLKVTPEEAVENFKQSLNDEFLSGLELDYFDDVDSLRGIDEDLLDEKYDDSQVVLYSYNEDLHYEFTIIFRFSSDINKINHQELSGMQEVVTIVNLPSAKYDTNFIQKLIPGYLPLEEY
jgi:nitrite reductase/ring-hydroxylating ferredoxin subunit